MNQFVEDCRSEWKRLGVPDPVADEMAADLAADLEEAEAEGASAEDVLGSGAFDPRAFAAAWAAERGVIRRPPPGRNGFPGRFRIAASIGTFALVAIAGAVLVIVASPSASRKLAVASPVQATPDGIAVVHVDPPAWTPGQERTVVVTETPPVLLRLPPAPSELGNRTIAVDITDDARILGSVLLTVGLAGLVPVMLFWLWVGQSRRSMQRDERPGAPAY